MLNTSMPEPVREFFEKKGSVEIWLAVDKNGSTWKEIFEQVDLSHETVSVRLGTAEDLDLLDSGGTHREGRATVLYSFTTTGRLIREIMEGEGLDITFHQLRAYRDQFDSEIEEALSQIEEIVEWDQEEEDEFDELIEATERLRNQLLGDVDDPESRDEAEEI